MKKTLSLVLALLMVLSLCCFTAGAETTGNTVTWMMAGDNNVADDNLVLQEVRNRTGVNLQVNYISSGDYNTKLNTLIAAETLPDIFSTSGQTALDLRDAGKIIDYSGLLEEYGPNILATYNGELEAMAVNSEGGVYGLVSLGGQIIRNLIIRKDWLANVNMEMPTNLDELYDVMYAFTYNDPDQNGENDTYGFAFTSNPDHVDSIFAAFGIPSGKKIVLEDGTVTTYMKSEHYLDAIMYFRKLYADGVIDPDFATLQNMEFFGKLWDGKIGMMNFQAVGITNNWYPGRYTFEVPADPAELFGQVLLTNQYTGEISGCVMPHVGTTGCACAIAASCEHPEDAVKVIDYMYFTKEGQDLIYLGVEGTMFNWVDEAQGKYERLGKYTDDTEHRAAGAFVYGSGYTVDNCENRTLNACTREMQATEKAVAIDYAFIPVTLDVNTEYDTSLAALEKEAFATLVVTQGDVEAEYAAFIERWEEEGGLEVEEALTEWWAENK